MANSIKFGRHLPEKRIAIAAEAVDGWVKLTLSDAGPGIPRRSLKQVFDDFYRIYKLSLITRWFNETRGRRKIEG